MAYSDFTLSILKNKFSLIVVEETNIFSNYPLRQPASWLADFLEANLSLALAINTEKARSELILAPIMVELKHHFNNQISLFSGTEFNIVPESGLNGRVDFLISRSPEQLDIEVPVAIIVEAKNENLNAGIPQCIAELIAANQFNENQKNSIPILYGVVTTGSLWKFLQLEGNTVTIDLNEYPLQPLEKIVGILTQFVEGSTSK
ncbi:MAG: hypothetical protein ACKPBV_12140 [Sphaerospermopsis kisseleviana]